MKRLVIFACSFGVMFTHAASQVTCEIDDFQQTTFCSPKGAPSLRHLNGLYLYTSQSKKPGARPALRISWAYSGERWIFLDSIQVLLDGQPYPPLPVKPKRDAIAGSVLERTDTICDMACIGLVKRISDAKVAKVRFSGSNGIKDVTISQPLKTELSTMLRYFSELPK